ncbi:hypothetical protein [Mesorhizobium sp. M0488]|uniref:hypothetical protein n=1 Tax=unclassified Mesorhizobium TaxID=325217 RepID=UPI00333D7373
MGDPIQFLKDNWAVVTQAPWVFVTLVIIVGGGGVAIGRTWLNRTISNLQSDIATLESRHIAKDEKIADYQSKLNGATPDEARNLISALERRLAALEPRNLDPEQSRLLSTHLSNKPGSIQLIKDVGSPESGKIYAQFGVLLRRLGWELMEGSVMGLGNPPPTGIAVQSHAGDTLTEDAKALIAALQAAGIEYDVQKTAAINMPGKPLTTLLFTTRAN